MRLDRDNMHDDEAALEERLSAYLDDALTPDERAAVEGHLAACAACRATLAELRQVRALLRALPAPALPRSFLLPPDPETAKLPAMPVALPAASTSRGRRGTRWASAAQWLGSIAAVIGFFVLVGSLVLAHSGGGHPTASSSGGPAYAPSASHTASATNAPATNAPHVMVPPRNPHETPALAHAEATATATSAGTPTPAPAPPASPSTPLSTEQLVPAGPIAGSSLIAGGIVLVFVGRTSARKRERERERAA